MPALVNTSLNVRGEPIVNSFEDAVCLFKSVDLSFLILNSRVVFREDQSPLALIPDERYFPLD